MNNRYLYILICLITLNACSDKTYLQQFADIKYNTASNPVHAHHINGFYVESDNGTSVKGDSLKSVLIFYKDGTFVRTFVRRTISSLIKKQPINLNDAVLKWGKKSQHWGQSYGLYKTSSDTICVTVYEKYWGYYNITKYKYKIVNPEHILLCYYESPNLNKKESYSSKMNIQYIFVPADSIPIPDNNFLKKKKWYWENESDWEEYMLKRKKKKNSK